MNRRGFLLGLLTSTAVGVIPTMPTIELPRLYYQPRLFYISEPQTFQMSLSVEDWRYVTRICDID